MPKFNSFTLLLSIWLIVNVQTLSVAFSGQSLYQESSEIRSTENSIIHNYFKVSPIDVTRGLKTQFNPTDFQTNTTTPEFTYPSVFIKGTSIAPNQDSVNTINKNRLAVQEKPVQSMAQKLVFTDSKPSWAWAVADTFWTNTFKYPSSIIDTEIDTDNNLYVAGFFSQKMVLGGRSINTINAHDAFCDKSETSDRRTGFIAKISANGTLLWCKKWNTQIETSDFRYCDLTIDNGHVFLVSEFNSFANCESSSNKGASLLMVNENDSLLASLEGYCKFQIPASSPAQYEYRYKGRFMWLAKFDLDGKLGTLTNLTELKACNSSTGNFDAATAYGLGNKGYYSIKARNNKLWLLYTWGQGLSGTLRFKNDSEVANDLAGMILLELNPTNLGIVNYQKINIYSPYGAMGGSNLEIDVQNNLIVSGSTAAFPPSSAFSITFGLYQLIFGDSDYFVAKYNTTTNNWLWATKSQFILVRDSEDLAPSIKTDSQSNIYLGFSMKTAYSGNFANITFPATPKNYDENNTAALLKINANGEGQWGKLNNHIIRHGRNFLAIDHEDNIYFASYLNNSATAYRFLINEHLLPQKDLASFSSTTGNPFVAIYKTNGNLAGTINNVRVYDGLYVNGLVIDSNKSLIMSGSNSGRASFGQLSLNTNFGDTSNVENNRQRAFISRISNPQSIVLDSTNTILCAGVENHIKFSTTGSFVNTSFKVQLEDVSSGKLISLGTSTSSPISFIPGDSLSGKNYFVRITTADNKVTSTMLPDKILNVHVITLPVLSSNLLSTSPVQGICYTDLYNYRFQSNISGQELTLKRNGVPVYTGRDLNFTPNEGQTGIYKASVEYDGCRAESAGLDFKVSRPAEAKLTGTQFLDKNNSGYLSLTLKGGGEYTVKINGIPNTLQLNKEYETIEVIPKQNTTYTLTSVSNYCGSGTVSGTAEITLCQNLISLVNPADNYNTGNILKEANNVIGEIIATNHISENAKVVYSAGKSITLNPGFSAANTGSFLAEIKGCANLRSTRENDYKIGYQKLHIDPTIVDRTLAEMTDFAEKGTRLFQVTIRLDEVFKSLSQFNETNPEKLSEYWAIYDKVIHHANNLYDHVAIRINVDYDDSRYYFQERDESDPSKSPYLTYENALFNLFGEIVQDQFNNPARVAYGSGHGSFSSLTATAKMKAFVQKVLDRYYSVLGNKLYWVSVANSGQYETGFNFENSWDGESFMSPRSCEYDYLPDNVNAFRTWLVTVRYKNLAAVNIAYNTHYTEAGQIEPPKVGVDNIQYMNEFVLASMYNSTLFEDWYQFNYGQMKKFLLDCKSIIKTKNNNIKFCFESGSCTDKISAARKTFDIPDIDTYADILKTALFNTSFAGIRSWDADIVRSNFTKEIETEINEMDIVNWETIRDPATVKQKMIEYSKAAYLNGAKSIIFISDKSTPYYNNSLDAMAEIKTWIGSHTEQLSLGQTININLTDLIRNYSAAKATFNTISSSLPLNGYENRPKIIINKNSR